MYNAVKRNRNIGTKKSGFKKQSNYKIPDKFLSESYSKADKSQVFVHNRPITFYIDKLKNGYDHACTIEEVISVLNQLPAEDVCGIKNIYFHQPSRKKEIFTPMWGSLRYYAGPNFSPIIIINAQKIPFVYKSNLEVIPFWKDELEFLKKNCESYTLTKRKHILVFQKEHIKQIQLYRTVPHEIGHWVDFKMGMEDLPFEEKERRANQYAYRYFN